MTSGLLANGGGIFSLDGTMSRRLQVLYKLCCSFHIILMRFSDLFSCIFMRALMRLSDSFHVVLMRALMQLSAFLMHALSQFHAHFQSCLMRFSAILMRVLSHFSCVFSCIFSVIRSDAKTAWLFSTRRLSRAVTCFVRVRA